MSCRSSHAPFRLLPVLACGLLALAGACGGGTSSAPAPPTAPPQPPPVPQPAPAQPPPAPQPAQQPPALRPAPPQPSPALPAAPPQLPAAPPPGAHAGPVLATTAPLTGAPGDRVTFTGSGLDQIATVTYAGLALEPGALEPVSPAELRVRIPLAAAVSGSFTLASPRGTLTSPVVQLVFQPPVLSGVQPPAAAPGTDVILTGRHLAGRTRVLFGEVPAAAVTVLEQGRVRARVPLRAEPGRSIRVITEAGTDRVPFRVLPVLTGVEPAQAAPGDVVRLLGAGLFAAVTTRVHLAGSWDTRIVGGNADHTELQVRVPAGGPGGVPQTFTIATREGRADSSVPFTLVYAAPGALALAPATGVPGTEVLLTGPGVDGVTEVLYGGAPLFPGTWRHEHDFPNPPRIVALVPHEAGSGVFTLRNPAGQVDSPPFTATPLARRIDLLTAPLVLGPSALGPQADYPSSNRSALYGVQWPKTPMFHAYHPFQGLRPGCAGITVQATLDLRLPDLFREALPAAVQAALARLPMAAAPLEIHLVTQNQPYQGPVLFRPHYFLYADTPFLGTAAADRARGAGMGFYVEPGHPAVHLAGHPGGVHLPGAGGQNGTSVHTSGPDGAIPSPMINSPNNLAMAGLDPTQSRVVVSVVQDEAHPTHPGRTVVTVHCLLQDHEQEALVHLLPQVLTFEDLEQAVGLALPGSPLQEELCKLVRPRLTAGTLTAPAAQGDPTPCTLQGSGFTGVTAVTVDGIPAQNVHLVDDGRIECAVPGLAGAGPHDFRVRTGPYLEGRATL